MQFAILHCMHIPFNNVEGEAHVEQLLGEVHDRHKLILQRIHTLLDKLYRAGHDEHTFADEHKVQLAIPHYVQLLLDRV